MTNDPYPKKQHLNNHTHIHTHMQQAKKLTVENVRMTDLVKEALSIPDGFHVEVYVENGKVSFSEPLTTNSWTDSKYNVGTIHSMSIGDVDGFYERESGKVEIEDESGKSKGEHYDNVIIVSRKEAIERIAENNEYGDMVNLLERIETVGTIRTWAAKHKGKYIHNRGEAGLTLLTEKEAAKIDYENSDKVEDYAEQLIETNAGLPAQIE